jgi:hypothetical protein
MEQGDHCNTIVLTTSDLLAIQQQFGKFQQQFAVLQEQTKKIQYKLETFVGHLELVQATNLALRGSMEERLLSTRLSVQSIRDGDKRPFSTLGYQAFPYSEFYLNF